MNPILLSRHVEEGLCELVHTTLNTTSPAFDGMVARFLDAPHNFIKGPWISVDMPFRQAVREDGTWQQPFPEIPLKFAPYQHQLTAFERLGADNPRSTLVATGTGSGKTESYLWPILEHCRKNKGKPGIKAILIYPMNALATDQARRIATALNTIPSLNGVRAGIYADAEPQDAAHEVTADSIITHRDAMRNDPPDILLTNYKMLDYLLLRGGDKKLWEANDPQALRFLVVDEMHTFDGAQGADLALLIRRLKSRLGTPENHLICVGSSATLGSGEEAAVDLRTYAETIFGERFDEGAVVSETRKTAAEVLQDPEYFEWPAPEEIRTALAEAENLDQPGAAMRLANCLFSDGGDPDLAELHSGDPVAPAWRILLGQLLLEHHICQRVLKIINECPGPSSIEEIATGFGQAKAVRGWDPTDHRGLAELVISLTAWARSGLPESPRPLFNVRLQLWIREMARMVTDLPHSLEGGRSSDVSLFHAADLDRHSLTRMLPIVNCNRCGAAAHVGRLPSGGSSFWAPLDQIYEEFFEDQGGPRIRLFYYESIDRKVNASSGLRIFKGVLNAETLEFQPGNHDDVNLGPASPVWMYDPTDDNDRIDRTCPACGHSQGLILFGMRAARITAGLSGILYTSMQNEEYPAAKPRLLMFSDSVQDAAQRAAVAEVRNARSVTQKSLFQALEGSDTRSLSLSDVITDLPSNDLDKLGGDAFTALFISKEQTWRKPYDNLTRNDISITEPVFLDHMKIRLGWEYFSDLTFRSHLSHTMEANAIATADVGITDILATAKKLSRQLHNAFPSTNPIPTIHLGRFLAGILQQMRRQGSVGHRYIAAGIATDTRGFGLNYFGAAMHLGLRRSQTLPVLNHRRGLAPTPITLRKNLAGFESIIRDHGSNWYRDWLFRTLAPNEFQIGTDPVTVFPIVLQRLEADAILRRVDRPEGHDGHGYLLEPDHISVSSDVRSFECTICKRREIGLTENFELVEGSSCTRIGCGGNFERTDRSDRPALRRSLTSDRNHRVVAREHTGILQADDRLRIENGFITGETRWSPNLISATPTLEMGIDIGDLSTLLLCSVPPEEANYVQRIGRSGRRDGNALNMTIANARSHDLQFWEDPTPMLGGQVKVPGVYISATAVLLRQVTAFTLDNYVASLAQVEDYGKVGAVLKRRRDGATTGFPFDWLALVEGKGQELADGFLGLLPTEVRTQKTLTDRITAYLTALDDTSLPWHISRVFDEVETDRQRLLQKRQELTREMARLKRRRAELTQKEFAELENKINRDRKELNRLIRTGIDDVSVLKFLTDKGVLPNYAFPEEGVKLTSILARRDETGGPDGDGLLYLEYSRPASSALSEFAPGQIFYANGRQVEIERIEMSNEDLSVWKFCQHCSHVAERHLETEGNTCPRCGDDMWVDSGSSHEVVRLKSVIAIDSEDKAAIRDSDQRQQQQFDRAMVPFYGPEDIGSSWYTKEQGGGAPFGFEFVANCTFRDFNFGRKTSAPVGPIIAGDRRSSQPFLICRHCGSMQRPARDDADRGTHPPSCIVMQDTTLQRDSWETKAFLMRGFQTEAIRVVIPVVGEMENDDIKSFIAAINLGMREHFAGKVDHIRSTVVEAQLDGIVTVRSLFLYDAVPGGSGYLRQMAEHPDAMRSVVTKAAEALRDCPCNQDPDKTGCYRCVKSYRSHFGPGEPDRDRARDLMEAILRKWETLSKTEQGIDKSIRSALVESELEQRFLGALLKAFGENALHAQVLEGGRRGFILKVPTIDLKVPTIEGTRMWAIEPQVQIDKRFKGLPVKRVDFLMTPVGRANQKAIVVEMDGLEYHAKTVAQDLEDRMLMIRSGRVLVWTLSWQDLLGEKARPPLNPLAENAMPGHLIGQIGKVLGHPSFSDLMEKINRLRDDGSFSQFCEVLGDASGLETALSIFLRAVIGTGRHLEDLPRSETISEEGRQFLSIPELKGHLVDRDLDLYLAAEKISPSVWAKESDDLRVLVRGTLPPTTDASQSNQGYTDAWRGLWRLISILQILRGFHVEFEGLDTLSPPDMLTPQAGPEEEMWIELKALCDDVFHPLIDALVGAELPPPDMIGDDIVENGRVVGMMEFGWSSLGLVIAEEQVDATGIRTLRYHPEVDPIGPILAQIIEIMGRADQ